MIWTELQRLSEPLIHAPDAGQASQRLGSYVCVDGCVNAVRNGRTISNAFSSALPGLKAVQFLSTVAAMVFFTVPSAEVAWCGGADRFR